MLVCRCCGSNLIELESIERVYSNANTGVVNNVKFESDLVQQKYSCEDCGIETDFGDNPNKILAIISDEIYKKISKNETVILQYINKLVHAELPKYQSKLDNFLK
jgi:hypothetical protein